MELEQGRKVGYTYLENTLTVLESGDLAIVENTLEQLQANYPELQDRLGAGEAEAFVAAHTTGGMLVTDDGAARTLAVDSDVALTGSIGVLVRDSS